MKVYLTVYLIRQAISSLRANRMLHVIGTGTMTVSILIYGFFLLTFVNLQTWVRGWGDNLFASVYILHDAEQAAREEIEKIIASHEGAEIVRVVSSDEALDILRRTLGSQSGILEELEGYHPLPLALDVVFRGPGTEEAGLHAFKKRVETVAGVDEVVLSEDWRGRARGMLHAFRLGGIVLGGFLALGVLFICVNTVKLTIYSRREELEIFKLVGATDWFVKIPFLIEGTAQGILSGGLAVCLLYSSYVLLAAQEIQLMGIPVLEVAFVQPLVLVMLFGGSVVLGLLGSLVAVSRFF